MKKDYNNVASLKDLMTAPRMTQQQHAKIKREFIEKRRRLEDIQDEKKRRDQEELF